MFNWRISRKNRKEMPIFFLQSAYSEKSFQTIRMESGIPDLYSYSKWVNITMHTIKLTACQRDCWEWSGACRCGCYIFFAIMFIRQIKIEYNCEGWTVVWKKFLEKQTQLKISELLNTSTNHIFLQQHIFTKYSK